MRRPLLRRLTLFLGITVPGFTVILVLAAENPVPRARRAVVRIVDPSHRPTVAVDMGDGRAAVGSAHDPVLADEGRVALRTKDGRTVTRPFRSWVLRCESAEPGPRGRRLLARTIRFEHAREPRDLVEYVALQREPRGPDATVDSREALLEKSGDIWARALLTGDVLLRVIDPEGLPGTLATESLLYRLATNRVESDGLVTVKRPGLTIVGQGLDADLDLRRVELLRDVVLTLDLATANLPWDPAGQPENEKGLPLDLRCSGPLRLEELDRAKKGRRRRVRVVARGGVWAHRGEASALRGRTLEMRLRIVEDPMTGRDRVEVVSLDVDQLRPLTLLTENGDPVRVEGDSLRWRRRGDENWEATVEGSPRIVILMPGSDPGEEREPEDDPSDREPVEIDIRCRGPAILLVSRETGLDQVVLRDEVVVVREDETLTADEVTVVRREGIRSVRARGTVVVDGERLHATADEARSTETTEGEEKRKVRTLLLVGSPVVVLRGTIGGDLFAASKEDEANGETQVRSSGPLLIVENDAGTTASTSDGATVIRRVKTREIGTLSSRSLTLRLSPGRPAEIVELAAHGAVSVEAHPEDQETFRAEAGHLEYRAEGETLTLEENSPTLTVTEAAGTTTLRGRRITWSRASGEFEVLGPVDASLPADVDLLRALQSAETRSGPGKEPVRLRCGKLTGVLLLGKDSRQPSLRAARAEGDVSLVGPDGAVRGTILDIIVDEKLATGDANASEEKRLYRAVIEGTPAHLERPFPGGLLDEFEGPILSVASTEDGEVRDLVASRGGRAVVHLSPRSRSGSLTRLDLESAGEVRMRDTSLTAPGGVRMDHRTWSLKRSKWGEPVKITGRSLVGAFVAGVKGGSRRVDSVEITKDVVVITPDGRRLTCAKAILRPRKETLELSGAPYIRMTLASGQTSVMTWAWYCYQADLETGTRWTTRGVRTTIRDPGRDR